MSDVDISIGARDEASRVLKGVREEIAKMGSTIESEAGRMDAATESLEISFGGVAVAGAVLAGVYAGFTGVRRAIDFAWEASEAYKVQEDASVGLTAALERQLATTRQLANQGSRDFAQDIQTAAGTEAQALREIVEGHEAYARSLQRMTGVGDEVILGIEQQAVMLGVQESQLDMVAKATLGISKATGLGYKTALRKVNETITGNTDALADYLPALKQTEDATRQVALVNELAMQGLNQHKNALNTLSGSQEAANAAMTDLRELVGSLIEPFRMMINSGIMAWASAMTDTLTPAVEDFNEGLGDLGEWTDWAARRGIVMAATMKTGWENMGDAATLMYLKLQLGWTQYSSSATNALEQVYNNADWFAENLPTVMEASWDVISADFTNTFDYIRNYWGVVWDWMWGGFTDGLDGVDRKLNELANKYLNDQGFVAPDMDLLPWSEREVSQYEKDMIATIQTLEEELSKKRDLNISEMMSKYEKAMEEIGLKTDLSSILKPDKELGKQIKNLQDLQATEARLLTRGPVEKPIDKLTKAVKDGNKLLKEIRDAQQDKKPMKLVVNKTSRSPA